MKLDVPKLGAGFMSAGIAVMQFGGSKATWYIGLAMLVVGPFCLAVRPHEKPPANPDPESDGLHTPID